MNKKWRATADEEEKKSEMLPYTIHLQIKRAIETSQCREGGDYVGDKLSKNYVKT